METTHRNVVSTSVWHCLYIDADADADAACDEDADGNAITNICPADIHFTCCACSASTFEMNLAIADVDRASSQCGICQLYYPAHMARV